MKAREVDRGHSRGWAFMSWDTHQGAPLCLGELGGHKVLYGSQQDDDGCSDQGTDPEDVVEENHAHNDLEKVTRAELSAAALLGSLPVNNGSIPPPTLYSVVWLSAQAFKMPWGWNRAQDQVWERKYIGYTCSQGSGWLTEGIFPRS